jgi:CheY-like chemotaxis protein
LPATSPLRIVVVDDDDAFRTMLVEMLEDVQGTEVVAQGASGEQAASLVRTHGADAVILDLRMPVTGWSALTTLRGKCPLVSIVVLTASGEEHQQDAMRAGADAFVRKVGRRDLIEEVAEALARVTRRPDVAVHRS